MLIHTFQSLILECSIHIIDLQRAEFPRIVSTISTDLFYDVYLANAAWTTWKDSTDANRVDT